ncbi:restriction endonuclease subunit S [Nitrosomonas oligotropha]|nr:restriction endonuclease subunit S [Nitrosomonas oligotropha]
MVNTVIGEAPVSIGDGNYSSKYPKRTDFLEAGVPFISANNLDNGVVISEGMRFISEQQHSTLKKGHLEKNDVLVVTRGNGIGNVARVDEKWQGANINAQLVLLRADDIKISKKYLFLYTRSKYFFDLVKLFSSGTAQPQLPIGALKKIPVSYPENIDDQLKIVRIVSAYDDLIENNKRRIELLEDSARQLYKEWFMRFRFPGHEHVKIIDGVPEGWESCPASDALHINPRVSVEKGKEIVCVPMASLSESQMTVDKSAFEQRTNHTSVKFMRGDTLFARITPCLENGKTAFVYFLEEGEIACGSTEFVVLRGKKVSNQFTYLLAREESFRGNAIKSMIGSSGRQRVQPSCFDKYIVPIAPDYIQEQFDSMVSSAFEQIAVLAKQNEQLARARDLLLPKLMGGEIAV